MKTAARIAFLLILTFAAPAAAQSPQPVCSVEPYGVVELFVGVRTATVALTCGTALSTAHVIRVDLRAPGLSFLTSRSASGGPGPFDQELTTDFLQRTHSQVAFNGNLFTNCCCRDVPPNAKVQTNLIGLEISDGKVLSPVQAKPAPLTPNVCGATPAAAFPFDGSLLVTDQGLRIERFDAISAIVPRAFAAVTGSHILVSGGQNVAPKDDTGEFFGPNARTVVGLNGENSVLWIAAIDRSTSQGVTLPQAGQLMILLGATAALNLDGGGSTSLAVEDAGGNPRLLNLPNDTASPCTLPVGTHCARYVGANFGIRALYALRR
jgi:hypothetical protein